MTKVFSPDDLKDNLCPGLLRIGAEKEGMCAYEVNLPPVDGEPPSGEDKSEGSEDALRKRGVGAVVKVFHFIMKQSYICALIAMMVSLLVVNFMRMYVQSMWEV